MADYIVHINVRIEKTGNHHVAITKDRLWHPIVSYLTWTLKGFNMPGFVLNGLALTFITNMAIVVEGIIADIVAVFLTRNNPARMR